MATDSSAWDEQTALIESLRNPACYPHVVDEIKVFETHISFLILTGQFVYKFKKPLDLGFLDYSTLEKRHRFCEEELRINRRTAPDLYLEVTSISGSPDMPLLNDDSAPIEYAVKMKQFSQQSLLSHLLDTGQITTAHIDQLAINIAAFHEQIEQAPPDSKYGDPAVILQPVGENFIQIREQISDRSINAQLNTIEQWALTEYQNLQQLMAQRKQDGFVRECHGDLHLNNITLINDQPTLFDAIEFNPNLRYIDTISEVAFLIMDLEARGRPDLAWRFLNDYLGINGDYDALPLLRFYLCYRAMVRAKINAIRVSQLARNTEDYQTSLAELQHYLDIAWNYTEPHAPHLVITHGLSGSGKTVVSQQLLEQWPAIRLRSDVERKRLFSLQAQERSQSGINSGIYTQDASERTYQYLVELAERTLRSGYNVIVDAAFLKYEQRKLFLQLAKRLQVPFHILVITASEATLRQRVASRHVKGSDASEADLAVLDQQLARYSPLHPEETTLAINVDTDTPGGVDTILSKLK